MLILAIDTAGSTCAAALAAREGDATTIVAARSEPIGRGHSERLMPALEAMLAEAGVTWSALQGVAVTTGPGSFVGVRVGVAAARGLALALGIPAAGVGSLDALVPAAAEKRREGTIVATIDARRGEIYVLTHDIASGAVLVEPEIVRPEDLAIKLSHAARPLIINGSGAPVILSMIDGNDAMVVGTDDHPEIADVARLAFRAGAAGPPKPLYLRGADARPQSGAAVARL